MLGGRLGAAGDHAAAKRDDAIQEVASRSDITNGALRLTESHSHRHFQGTRLLLVPQDSEITAIDAAGPIPC